MNNFPYWFLIFVPLLVIAILYFLSWAGGWRRLADRYRAVQKPDGKRFPVQSARVGWVNYNNCLSIRVTPYGLWIAVWPIFSFGHSPLLIPWPEMHDFRERRVFGWRFVSFSVGFPEIARMMLVKKVLDSAREFLPQMSIKY